MRFPKIAPLSGGIAALLFMVGAGSAFLGLEWLARPSEFAARLDAAEAAQQAVGPQGRAGLRRFPDTAVCGQATVSASKTLRQTLSEMAGRHGLAVSQLRVAPSAPERALPGLAAIDVELVATGSQSSALALVADLERASPVVFVDQLGLRPKGGGVTVNLTGRAFCAISAR